MSSPSPNAVGGEGVPRRSASVTTSFDAASSSRLCRSESVNRRVRDGDRRLSASKIKRPFSHRAVGAVARTFGPTNPEEVWIQLPVEVVGGGGPSVIDKGSKKVKAHWRQGRGSLSIGPAQRTITDSAIRHPRPYGADAREA